MIDYLGGWLQHNLLVFVAVVVLPLKFVIVRLCRDREAEAIAVLSVPEDICWVSLGLVMGDMINSKGAFRKHFSYSEHAAMDIFITVALNLGVAIGVHRAAQICQAQFKFWRAAQRAQEAHSNPDQAEFPLPSGRDNLQLLMLRHLLLFCLVYLLQLGAVLFWLSWIARVLAEPTRP